MFLRLFTLVTEYQDGIEPLLDSLVTENVIEGYTFNPSPTLVGSYKGKKERSAVVQIASESQAAVEEVAQRICELRGGHEKRPQESVMIAIDDVDFYENKKLDEGVTSQSVLTEVQA